METTIVAPCEFKLENIYSKKGKPRLLVQLVKIIIGMYTFIFSQSYDTFLLFIL